MRDTGDGYGWGDGYGRGYGNGFGRGYGDAFGLGDGYGFGFGYGYGDGSGCSRSHRYSRGFGTPAAHLVMRTKKGLRLGCTEVRSVRSAKRLLAKWGLSVWLPFVVAELEEA